MKIAEENAIKAYKVMDPHWKCQNFEYAVGKTYHRKGRIIPGKNGFHACKKPATCFNYYEFVPANHVCEVLLFGTVRETGANLCASDITIVKELHWEEVLELANTGEFNTGYANTGSRNSGYANIGNNNTGSYNVGDFNCGDWNYGSANSGRGNYGNHNSGDRNSGNANLGHSNQGDYNSGDRNSGDFNYGEWNSGSWNYGYFNTNEPDMIRVFNRMTSKKCIAFPRFLYFHLNVYVDAAQMSAEEKAAHPEAKTMGGYLRTLEYKEAFRASFLKAKKKEDWPEERMRLLSIPNFDFDIFEEISGIKKEEILEGMTTKTKKGKKK